MARSPFLPLLLSLLSVALFCVADEQLPSDPTPRQTCFDYTGRPLTNNTQCPGSNACCHYAHQCTGNLLCTQDDSDEYVNSLCAVNPWSDCSNICQYGADLNQRLPRVIKCSDGKYCCNSDISCCEKGRGYVLDGKGNIVSSSSSSESPTSSPTSSTPQPSSTDTPTTSPSITPTSPPSNSGSDLPIGAKVGIGVAVAFSVLSFIVLVAIFIMKRRRRNTAAAPPSTPGPRIPPYAPPYELDSRSLMAELPAEPPEKNKFSSRQWN